MEDDGQKLRVTVMHPNGRRSLDPVSKARLVESCLQPGASVAQLALNHRANSNRLSKWIDKQRLANKETLPTAPPSTPAFIPVHIEAAAPDLRPNNAGVRLRPSDGTHPLSSPAKVSALLANGVKLTLEGDVWAVTAKMERCAMFRLAADVQVCLHREADRFPGRTDDHNIPTT
jgi:transposase